MHWIVRIGLPALGGLLCISPDPAEAEGPSSLTLDWAVREAVERNPQIAAARSRWGAAVEEVPQVRSLDDPGVYTMFWAVPRDTPNPFSAREIWYGIKQRFPFPGKLELRGRVAERTAAVAEQRYRSVQEEVLRRVKAAYYDLFLIHREMEITQKHLDLMRQFADIAETRYATYAKGGAVQGDVLKALVEVSDLANRVLVLEQKRRAAGAKLNALLDRAPEAPLGIPADFPVRPVRYMLVEMKRMALENRPELRSLKLAIERAEVSRALAEKDYYPDFMADFSYWDVENSPNRWMLMVEVKVPIAFWSKGKHDARVRQAEVEKQAWEAEYGELKNQVLYALEDACVDVQVAQNNVDLYSRTIIPQAQQTVEVVQASYETDRATFLNLVDSERTLLRFELDYYRSMVNYEKGVADLERAVGASLRVPRMNGGE